jgi:thioredoxin 1
MRVSLRDVVIVIDQGDQRVSDAIETYTDQNWEKEVVASDRPVLVDFWAEWCKPCLAMVPDLEAVAVAYKGRLRVGKVNVEENNDVAFKYNVTGMPTLLVLKGGKVLEQRVGKLSKDALVKLVEPHLT